MRRFLILCTLLLAACSGADAVNRAVPTEGYTLTRDIAYAKGSRHGLDIYAPEGAHNAPVVLFFYGGSWQRGQKEDYRFVGEALASHGVVTVVADYRLYPEIYFPEFVKDSALALRWVHHNIRRYGGDSKQLFVAGHSAGAFNATMLVLDKRHLAAVGGNRRWVKGVIGLAGPYDFLPITEPPFPDIFNKRPLGETQPIFFVEGTLPPFFLATGGADDMVDAANTRHLATRLRANGTGVTEHVYTGIDHIGIILSLANGFRTTTPLLGDIIEFVKNPPE